jgi:hypothetical protein
MLVALLADRMCDVWPADTQAQFRMFLIDLVFPTTSRFLGKLFLFDYCMLTSHPWWPRADHNSLALVLQ